MSVTDIEGSSIKGRMTSCNCPHKTSRFSVNYIKTPKIIKFFGVIINNLHEKDKTWQSFDLLPIA